MALRAVARCGLASRVRGLSITAKTMHPLIPMVVEQVCVFAAKLVLFCVFSGLLRSQRRLSFGYGGACAPDPKRHRLVTSTLGLLPCCMTPVLLGV